MHKFFIPFEYIEQKLHFLQFSLYLVLYQSVFKITILKKNNQEKIILVPKQGKNPPSEARAGTASQPDAARRAPLCPLVRSILPLFSGRGFIWLGPQSVLTLIQTDTHLRC